MRRLALCAAAAAVASGIGTVTLVEPAQAPAAPRAALAAATPNTAERRAAPARASSFLLDDIDRYRQQTWRWQRLMMKPRSPSSDSARRTRDPAYRRWVLELWRARAARVRRQAANPPHERHWRCIQRYEGAWTDPNAPYWGGLQMDMSFQRTYGWELLRRKGTADNWSPLEQMWVAERAHRSGRGFTPWPNTARYCGLL
jgi:hypothetical protein